MFELEHLYVHQWKQSALKEREREERDEDCTKITDGTMLFVLCTSRGHYDYGFKEKKDLEVFVNRVCINVRHWYLFSTY